MINIEGNKKYHNFIRENYTLLDRYSSHGYVLAKTLNKLASDLEPLEIVLSNFPAPDFIKSQIAKFLGTKEPSTKKFREVQLITSSFPNQCSNKQEFGAIKVPFPDGEEKKLEDILLKFSSKEIFKILLYTVLKDLFISDSALVITTDFTEFSQNLYKALKDVFEFNSRNATLDEKNAKLKFIFIVDLMQAIHKWMKEVIRYLVTVYQEIELLRIEFGSIAASVSDEQEAIEALIPGGNREKFMKMYQSVKERFPCLVNNYEKEIITQGKAIFQQKQQVFSFVNHPLHKVQIDFLIKNLWQEGPRLSKFESALIGLMTYSESNIAQQLGAIFLQQNLFKHQDVSIAKLFQDCRAILEAIAIERRDQLQVRGSRSNSFSASINVPILKSSSQKKSLERTRSRSLIEPQIRSSVGPDFFRGGSDKSEVTSPSNNFPKFDVTTINQKLLDFFNNETAIIHGLEKYSSNMIKFIQDFELKVRSLESFWFRGNIAKFLNENYSFQLKRLKLLLIAHYFDPTICLNNADILYDRKEEWEEEMKADIEYLYKKAQPVQIRELGRGYRSRESLTIEDILVLNDFKIVSMLNAYNLPSNKSDRHPFEKKIYDLIELLTTPAQGQIEMKDYDSACFNFYVNSMGIIGVHLQSCIDPIIHFWFIFSHSMCAFKKMNIKSEGIQIFESFYREFTDLIKELMDMDMAKRIIIKLLSTFCNLSGEILMVEQFNALFTINLRSGILESLAKLDCGNLLENAPLPSVKERIQEFQEFISQLFSGLATHFQEPKTMLTVFKKIQLSGILSLYETFNDKSFRKELIESMLENLKEFNISRADYIENDEKLKSVIPVNFVPKPAESNIVTLPLNL